MGIIRILDEQVSNIIAAGEVVESPSSLVKELLENAIDAKSKNISIEVKDGGRYIRIVDDGVGMEREDLLLCVERHATSKIREKEDIFNLSTYGFRGEALSSICAVSKVKISSKTEKSEGNVITILGNKVTSFKEAPLNRGTEIEVKELFFNTPARLKFLRKEFTEYSYIKEIVFQEALANPNIAISLTLNGKEGITTSGNGMQNAIIEIFGRHTLKNLIEFELGFLGNSTISRATKDSIYIFVNGRIVKSKLIETAIIDSYYTKLSKGKYPFVLLFLNVSGKDVDVNVHPSKKIVKFSNDTNIYNLVSSKIKEIILKNDNLTARELDVEVVKAELKYETKYENPPMENIKLLEIKDEIKLETNEKIELETNDKIKIEIDHKKKIEENNEIKNIFTKSENSCKLDIPKNIHLKKENQIKIIGQFMNSYIIVENGGTLELYDQHIVHERILYEEYKKSYEEKEIKSQGLLIPQRVVLEPKDMDKVLENIEILTSFGFEIEEFGKNEILIRSIPVFSMKESIEEFFRELLSELSIYRDRDPREGIIIAMSCKSAIKAGEELKNDEMLQLVKKLHAIGEYTCPHGRPIILRLGIDEIEKKFKRR